MTQRIKLLSLILLTLCFIHCEGPDGRRLGAYNLNNQQQAGHSQTGNAFTAQGNSNILPNGLIEALLGKKEAPLQVDPVDTGIRFSSTDWNTLCSSYPDVDTDNDGIRDDCEVALKNQGNYEYAGLDPLVYNGWVFGGRYVNASDPSWLLDAVAQEEIRKQIEKNGIIDLAKLNSDAAKVVTFLEHEKLRTQSDMPSMRNAYYNPSNTPMRISKRFFAPSRSDLFYKNKEDDRNLGLGSGEGIESFPYHTDRAGDSVAYLTGFGKDSDSYREHANGDVKITSYHTHVIFPEGVDEIEVTIAYLSKNSVLQPKSNVYYAINNGDSILSQNQWISDQGSTYKGSVFGRMTKNIGCDTGDLTVYAIMGGEDQKNDTVILPELVVFRGFNKSSNQWSTLSQGDFSIVPQGGAQCHATFNDVDPTSIDDFSFFKTVLPIDKLVPKTVNVNKVLGNGVYDISKVLDRNTTSLDGVKGIITAASIAGMDEKQLQALNNAFANLDTSKLSAADQEWLAARLKDMNDRRTALSGGTAPTVTVDDQLKSLESLINDADFTNKTGDIDALIAALEALDKEGKLTPEQKAKLEALKKANADKKNAANKPSAKVITVGDQGDVTLTADDMRKLQELGFILQNEDGTPYTPVDGEVKKISKEQLQAILDELGNQLDTGKYAPGKGPKDIVAMLDRLEKSNPDSKQAIDDFRSKYQSKLPNFAEIEKKLTDPTTLSTYPIDQRLKDLEQMRQEGLLTADQYIALRLNIEKLRDLSNQDFSFKATTITYENQLKNVIELEGASIQFASGSNEIRSDSQKLLKRIAKEVQNYRSIKQQIKDLNKETGDVKVYVLLRAYTDPSGKSKNKATRDKNNTQLSQCRSDAVKGFFSGADQITKCDSSGKQTSKKFAVVPGANLDATQIIDAANIISQGMGPDYITKGSKPKKADYEVLRRVEIFLSEKPF